MSYDIGGLLGSIFLGLISDKFFSKRSPVAFLACVISVVISFIITFTYLHYNTPKLLPVLVIVMLVFAFFIAGLNNMVSSSCSADLAKASAMNGNANGAATIMGII
jgi:sugar phosphate permease